MFFSHSCRLWNFQHFSIHLQLEECRESCFMCGSILMRMCNVAWQHGVQWGKLLEIAVVIAKCHITSKTGATLFFLYPILTTCNGQGQWFQIVKNSFKSWDLNDLPQSYSITKLLRWWGQCGTSKIIWLVVSKHEASKLNNWFEDELFNLFQRLTEMQTLIHGHSPENGNIVLVSEGL